MEFAFIGSALGRGFNHTTKLHIMNYREAMSLADKDKWIVAMEEEHDRMAHHQVWKAVPPSEVQDNAKTTTSTWANKKKVSGTYPAQPKA
jgi:hypothetical protein